MLKKEQGSALLIVLIILSILIVSSLSLVTSTQSTTVVAGNIAFKSGASSIADIGVAQAITTLTGITNLEVAVPNQYFPTQQPVDINGIPTTVTWSSVPTITVQNYSLQFVIDRLCIGTTPIANISTSCTTALASQASSKKVGGAAFNVPLVFFRVTALVTGPKNSTSYIQAILQQ